MAAACVFVCVCVGGLKKEGKKEERMMSKERESRNEEEQEESIKQMSRLRC